MANVILECATRCPDNFPSTVRGISAEAGMAVASRLTMLKRSPFCYLETSPEIIRLSVEERIATAREGLVRRSWHKAAPDARWRPRMAKNACLNTSRSVWKTSAGSYVGCPVRGSLKNVEDLRSKAALKFLRKSMKRFGRPHVIVSDLLRSYGAAMKVIGNVDRQETGRWLNNRAENSYFPFRRRERAMLRFRRSRSLQKFVSAHASVCNHFNQERHLYSRANYKLNRAAAVAEWPQLGTA